MSIYRTCMTEAMRKFPKGISREERGKLFCTEAKLCSGKVKDKKEAESICSQPREIKEKKTRVKKTSLNCGQKMATLAGCAIDKLDLSQGTSKENIAIAFAIALRECECKSG